MNTPSTADFESSTYSSRAETQASVACHRRFGASLSVWARAVLLLPVLLACSFATNAATCNIGVPVAAAGYSTSNFANNFPYNGFAGCVGAAGIAFDASGNMYVVDETDGNLYKFPPAGGLVRAASVR